MQALRDFAASPRISRRRRTEIAGGVYCYGSIKSFRDQTHFHQRVLSTDRRFVSNKSGSYENSAGKTTWGQTGGTWSIRERKTNRANEKYTAITAAANKRQRPRSPQQIERD